jgi:hypothetical protein
MAQEFGGVDFRVSRKPMQFGQPDSQLLQAVGHFMPVGVVHG